MLGRKLLIVLSLAMAGLAASVDFTLADNCTSACNQVRRVCREQNKLANNGQNEVCDGGRGQCRTDCGGNGGCPQSCNRARSDCRADAHGQRKSDDELCEAGRSVCRETCDGDDAGCVDDCGETVTGCLKQAKRNHDGCRKNCKTAADQEACRATCNSELVADNDACVTAFDDCLTDCMTGTTLAPTTTVPEGP